MIINNRQYNIKCTVYYENKGYCVENIATSSKGLKAFCYIVEYNDDGTNKSNYWKWIYKAENRELWRLIERRLKNGL